MENLLEGSNRADRLVIRFFRNNENSSWDQFVMEHDHGTLFHLTSWKEVIERSFGHKSYYLMAEHCGKLVGVLPLFEMKSFLFGHYLVSLPFAEVGGALGKTPAIENALVHHASSMTERFGANYLELRNRESRFGLKTKRLYVNFKKRIFTEPEKNLKAIPRKSRAMVRKGINKGLNYKVGHEYLDCFYEILQRNYHRLGTPIFSKFFFKNFLSIFNDQVNILIVFSQEGKPASAVMFFIFRDQMIPYYAGSEVSMRELAPNDFMYWSLMNYGISQGCTIFDYGRSKIDTGSFRFKKHWGFEPTPLFYQYYLSEGGTIPNLSPANPKYRKKIELWKQMPEGLVRHIGPLISRHLG